MCPWKESWWAGPDVRHLPGWPEVLPTRVTGGLHFLAVLGGRQVRV